MPAEVFQGGVSEEAGAADAVGFGVAVDLGEHWGTEGDIDPQGAGFWNFRGHRNNADDIGIVVGDGRWGRNGFTGLDHAIDMPLQGFLRIPQQFIKILPGGDAPGEVRKVDSVIRSRILADNAKIMLLHGELLVNRAGLGV